MDGIGGWMGRDSLLLGLGDSKRSVAAHRQTGFIG